ncbi:MAG: hypothetical protein IB618_02215 [Candidatus Pacearchaeota archaeon]|nr:MAG: hypothetical protein IB618_02215 [Candidatus Pacearchaeota archaeon]
MQETIETIILKQIFETYEIDITLILGRTARDTYEGLGPVLGFKKVYHAPQDSKGHKICKYVKKSKIVIGVPDKKNTFGYYIHKALKKYPIPYIHTKGGPSKTDIVKSLYNKKDRLVEILKKDHGEI